MCISQSASLGTFIISTVLSGVLAARGTPMDLWTAAFVMSFNSVQLIEYFIWKGLDTDDKRLNATATGLIPVALFSQPLVQSVGSYAVTGNAAMKSAAKLFLLIFIYILSTKDNYEYISEIGEHKHLVWYKIDKQTHEKTLLVKYNYGLMQIYIVGLIAGLMLTSPSYYGFTLASYGVASFLFISYKYPSSEFSSMWCLVAIFYGVLALTIPH
jgi:hypothetical protein